MTNNSTTISNVNPKAAAKAEAKAAKAEARRLAREAKAAAEAKARGAAIVTAAVARIVAIIRALAGQSLKLHISRENKKLVPNEFVDFVIWNLPAIFTCPFRTLQCTLQCYARKAETPHFKGTLIARVSNYLMSKLPDFVDIMSNEILKITARSKKKYIIVRIHESGDFYNRVYAQKWLEICRRCSVDKRIVFIAYTKSFIYFDGVKLPNNFRLRASIWADTTEAQKEIVKRNGWPIYTAVDKFQKGDNFTRCRCSDCAGCRHCWQNYKDIRCQIH